MRIAIFCAVGFTRGFHVQPNSRPIRSSGTTVIGSTMGAASSAADFANKFERIRIVEDAGDEHTVQEAEKSASLYMNPATAKVASGIAVSWEPAVANLITTLEQVHNPVRPLLIGIVGIPGEFVFVCASRVVVVVHTSSSVFVLLTYTPVFDNLKKQGVGSPPVQTFWPPHWIADLS